MMKYIHYVLYAWGGISLAIGILWLFLSFYAAASPNTVFNPGSISGPEWIGMGVLCLGLAHVITQLEQLNQNKQEENTQRKD